MDSKVWWQSKQLWVAAIAFVATLIQGKWGFVVSPEYQGLALAFIMAILRIQTTKPVTLTSKKERE